MTGQGPVLLYDGLCGFCDRTVRLVLRFDRRGVIRFAPLQGEFAATVLLRHAWLGDVDSLVLVEPGPVGAHEAASARSAALLGIARHLGGAWRLLGIFALAPQGLRDRAYDVFARHRYRLFGRYTECPIPSPEVRSRFLA